MWAWFHVWAWHSGRAGGPARAGGSEGVARFWRGVLGYAVPGPPEGSAAWDDSERSLPLEGQGSGGPSCPAYRHMRPAD